MAKKKGSKVPRQSRNILPLLLLAVLIAVMALAVNSVSSKNSLSLNPKAAKPDKPYLPFVAQNQWIGAEWFGRWEGTEEVAQTFVPSSTRRLRLATVSLLNTFNGDENLQPAVTLEIWSDGGNQPGTLLGSSLNSIKAYDTNSYLTDYDFYFDGPRLRSGQTYWLVARVSLEYENMPFGIGYWHDYTDAFPTGQFWHHTNGVWANYDTAGAYAFNDLYFKLYY